MDTDAALVSSANFRKNLNQISKNLVTRDLNQLKYLLTDIIPRSRLDKVKRGNELFTALEDQGHISCSNTYLIAEAIFQIKRYDIFNNWHEWSRQTVSTEILSQGSCFTPFRLLLHHISGQLCKQDVSDMKFAVIDFVQLPRNKLDECTDPLAFFTVLEQVDAVSPNDLTILKDLLETIDRNDLIQHIDSYYGSTFSGPGQPGDRESGTRVNPPPPAHHLLPSAPSLGPNSPLSTGPQTPEEETMSLKRRLITTPEDQSVEARVADRNTLRQPLLQRDRLCGNSPGQQNIAPPTGGGQYPTEQPRVRQPVEDSNENITTTTTTTTTMTIEDAEESRRLMIQRLNQLTLNDMPCYPMNKSPRGIAVIISNYQFYVDETNPQSRHYPKREGTQIDEKLLTEIFKELGFQVDTHPDRTAEQILRLLNEYSQLDHTQYDAFIVCIMTHGLLGKVCGCDGVLIEIPDITRKFKALDCPSLSGKPKLFFIQACQGKTWQEGAEIEADSGEGALETDHVPTETIPNESDFLLGYATVPGYVSYRSKSAGSWYITTLVQTIRRFHPSYDLQTILTKVTEEMSKRTAKEKFKQCPLPWSTLRMRLFFTANRFHESDSAR